eukprot:1620920-Pleurochrysis_carterae.AAC.1
MSKKCEGERGGRSGHPEVEEATWRHVGPARQLREVEEEFARERLRADEAVPATRRISHAQMTKFEAERLDWRGGEVGTHTHMLADPWATDDILRMKGVKSRIEFGELTCIVKGELTCIVKGELTGKVKGRLPCIVKVEGAQKAAAAEGGASASASTLHVNV